jgi:hypothetical protein
MMFRHGRLHRRPRNPHMELLQARLACLHPRTRCLVRHNGFLAEILSRKYAILVNVAIFIIGVIVQCIASVGDVGHNAILGGRFITGMGVGSLSMIVPMYNAEIAPP